MVYDKPIIIQKLNEDSEEWESKFMLHARINKNGNSEYLKIEEDFKAGSSRSKSTRVFELRFFKALEDIDDNRDYYRILYRGRTYNIINYDDYLEEHKTIKLLGVSYG